MEGLSELRPRLRCEFDRKFSSEMRESVGPSDELTLHFGHIDSHFRYAVLDLLLKAGLGFWLLLRYSGNQGVALGEEA